MLTCVHFFMPSHSICLAPKIPRRVVDAFIEPKSPVKTYRRDDDDNSGDYRPASQSSVSGSAGPTTRFQEKKSNSHRKVDGGGDGAKDAIGTLNLTLVLFKCVRCFVAA